eukprot:Sspe_Gene.84342::Locus_55361_Transcript_2_3_Confidence_0.333_Length_1264::g.84342::m.84342
MDATCATRGGDVLHVCTNSVMTSERYRVWREKRRKERHNRSTASSPSSTSTKGSSTASLGNSRRHLSHAEALRAFGTVHQLPRTNTLIAWLESYTQHLSDRLVQHQVEEIRGREAIEDEQEADYHRLRRELEGHLASARRHAALVALHQAEATARVELESEAVEGSLRLSQAENVELPHDPDGLEEAWLIDRDAVMECEGHTRNVLMLAHLRMAHDISALAQSRQAGQHPPDTPTEQQTVAASDATPPSPLPSRPSSSVSTAGTTVTAFSPDPVAALVRGEKEGRARIEARERRYLEAIEAEVVPGLLRIFRKRETKLFLAEREARHSIAAEEVKPWSAFKDLMMEHRSAVERYLADAVTIAADLVEEQSVVRERIKKNEKVEWLVLQDIRMSLRSGGGGGGPAPLAV